MRCAGLFVSLGFFPCACFSPTLHATAACIISSIQSTMTQLCHANRTRDIHSSSGPLCTLFTPMCSLHNAQHTLHCRLLALQRVCMYVCN